MNIKEIRKRGEITALKNEMIQRMDDIKVLLNLASLAEFQKASMKTRIEDINDLFYELEILWTTEK